MFKDVLLVSLLACAIFNISTGDEQSELQPKVLTNSTLESISANPTGYLHGMIFGHNATSNQTIFDRIGKRLGSKHEKNYTLDIPEMFGRTRTRLRERINRIQERLRNRLQKRYERYERRMNKRINRWINIIDQHNDRSGGDDSRGMSFGSLRKMLEQLRDRISLSNRTQFLNDDSNQKSVLKKNTKNELDNDPETTLNAV